MAKSIVQKCHKRALRAGTPDTKSYAKTYGACMRKKYGAHHAGLGRYTKRRRKSRRSRR
jgi:hypothetical protein